MKSDLFTSIRKHISVKATALILGLAIIIPVLPLTALAALDTTAPTVTLNAPVNGSTVSNTVTISANATDVSAPASACIVTISGIQYNITTLVTSHSGGDVFTCGTDMTSIYQGRHGTSMSRMSPYIIPSAGIARVEFSVDGVLASTDTSSAYSFEWNSATVANGSHTLSARSFDLANNPSTISSITVTVSNSSSTPADTTAPLISITLPTNNATTSGVTTINASTTDAVGVTKVEFYIDNSLIATDTVAPFSILWDTKGVTNGTHSLTAKAYDAGNNIGTSSITTVVVSNSTQGTNGNGGTHEKNKKHKEKNHKEHEERESEHENKKSKNEREHSKSRNSSEHERSEREHGDN